MAEHPEMGSFAGTHFKRIYSQTECPSLQHEFCGAVHAFLDGMCKLNTIPQYASDTLFERLQYEAFQRQSKDVGQTQCFASQMWLSPGKLQAHGIAPSLNVEFCSLLNAAIRDDIEGVMPQLTCIASALNSLPSLGSDAGAVPFPYPDAVCHRGGCLPLQHLPFFEVGKKYRVPMFLSTAQKQTTAFAFVYACLSNAARHAATERLQEKGCGAWESTGALDRALQYGRWRLQARARH